VSKFAFVIVLQHSV